MSTATTLNTVSEQSISKSSALLTSENNNSNGKNPQISRNKKNQFSAADNTNNSLKVNCNLAYDCTTCRAEGIRCTTIHCNFYKKFTSVGSWCSNEECIDSNSECTANSVKVPLADSCVSHCIVCNNFQLFV